MQANPRSLDTLFNSQLRYVVPMFQRLYVWQEKPQWTTLWEDIEEKVGLQLKSIANNPHYLGAVIIEGVKPLSPREVKRFLIIDGQQRLTTLQLLLCAFRDISRHNNWRTLDRTATRYIENADIDVMEYPEEEKFKLWPTTLNRTYFSEIISAGSRAAIEEKYPLVRLKYKRKHESRHVMVNAYIFFYDKISSLIGEKSKESSISAEECAFKLLQSLQQDFCVVEISLSEGDDSQEIFYSLNSQGRQLSQSDLLRSLIFMRAEKEKQNRDNLFENYWCKFETEFWSQEIGRGDRRNSRLDIGLRYFLSAKTGEIIETRRVNEKYKQWINAQPPIYQSVCDELDDFTKHCDIFREFDISQPNELARTDIKRIVKESKASTALPLLMFINLDAELTQQQADVCLRYIESFLVRRLFNGDDTKEYNRLFVDVIKCLKNEQASNISNALREKLLSGGGATRQWPTDEDIMNRAINAPIFNQLSPSSLRFILEKLELSMRSNKSEDHSLPSDLQIEHVMPQKWGEHWPINETNIPPKLVAYPYLLTMPEDKTSGQFSNFIAYHNDILLRNSKLHTIGNLTLLNKHLNPSVGNASFHDKKKEYTNSVLRLNRYFDNTTIWDESAIQKRSSILGSMLCKLWPRYE